MQSTVVKRSIVFNGHKTSVSLEHEFWTGLKEIARAENRTLSACIATIDEGRANGNLSSAIRVYVLGRFKDLAFSLARPGDVPRPALSASSGGPAASSSKSRSLFGHRRSDAL
jgi:predicted DNA-binding ribbon-helix-helix protein